MNRQKGNAFLHHSFGPNDSVKDGKRCPGKKETCLFSSGTRVKQQTLSGQKGNLPFFILFALNDSAKMAKRKPAFFHPFCAKRQRKNGKKETSLFSSGTRVKQQTLSGQKGNLPFFILFALNDSAKMAKRKPKVFNAPGDGSR